MSHTYCPKCSGRAYRHGYTGVGIQRWHCISCGFTFREGYAWRARFDNAARQRALEIVDLGGSGREAAEAVERFGYDQPTPATISKWRRGLITGTEKRANR